ncbi:DUF1405 domain-containing protein [Bhargavaea massiliensis]|uniref:DUF1405 domain-containing protein n=1 Tax=Bhargavaea massiliensis TaxID=2697500 RepID=UPI001BD1419A|nr:DUF1405 domain-containing protein [Bhargavaea massiliensis]
MQSVIPYIRAVLEDRRFLILLFFINLGGTIYGYIWYESQLRVTRPIFLLFVPDSPTASLFFTLAIAAWIWGRHWKLIEALALITLVKYGLWAVVMNIWTLVEVGTIGFTGWMLVASHFLMAVQAVLYLPKYAFGIWHITLAAVWTLHNDVIDYVFGQMPVYGRIMEHIRIIGYFTFWLSIACIALAVYAWHRRNVSVAAKAPEPVK